ncbi:MAG: chloramphenicol acetyltransferase [Dorea sp.]|jgi:chloramphenicol O-acetyltransferase type A|nr:chloramphenicol acetyltransferase [Dorea sp.]
MKKIDIDLWGRKELFDFFSKMSQPFYSVTFTVDVTKIYNYVKRKGLSFYYALVYLCTEAVNDTEAFLYVVQEGEIYKLSRREPSFTDLKPGSENFYIVTMPSGDKIDEFCLAARKKSSEQTGFIDEEQETDGLIYFTCLPWIELTALTNERDFCADDSVPRIAWGKYREENGRKTLQMSMELNHRFVDGVHVGKFYEALRRRIENLE